MASANLDTQLGTLSTHDAAAVDTTLSAAHGSGNWEGGATAPTVDQIDTKLAAEHGLGAWTTATGFAVPGSPMTLTASERDSVATAILDLASAIDGVTLRAALRYIAATVAGKVSGAGSGVETFLGLDGSTARLKSTIDDDGNRTAIDYDP